MRLATRPGCCVLSGPPVLGCCEIQILRLETSRLGEGGGGARTRYVYR